MKLKNFSFDTYESSRFPLERRVVGIRLAEEYVREYKSDMKTYFKIRWRLLLGRFATFGIGLLLAFLAMDISVYLSGVIFGAAIMADTFIVPELIIRHHIKNGDLTPPPRGKK